MRDKCLVLFTVVVVMAVGKVASISAADSGRGHFRAGAARIDITPSLSDPVPMSGFGGRSDPFTKVHDHIYYRAIVLDDGNQKVAILVGDVLAVSDAFSEKMGKEIELQFGIPQQNVLLCTTHTHAAPTATYHQSDEMTARILALVKEAVDNLEPAQVGAAKGDCNVNINRCARTATGNTLGGWWLGQNPDGPADKTMHVVKFQSLDGCPIAILVNYAAHGTTMGQDNMQISGDHPGACSRFVEAHYENDVVVAWTSGAAGDIDPIYAYRTDFGGRISPIDVLGRIQGEEVIRLANRIKATEPGVIHARQSVIAVPGRKNLSGKGFRPDGSYEFANSDPVDVCLSVLQLGDIAICGVSAEVLTLVGQRLKERSPLENTIMVTHANGDSGYLPNDEAYEHIGYEILVTPFQPGVERLAIEELLRLLNVAKRAD